jgi:prephenate dehydrogenase
VLDLGSTKRDIVNTMNALPAHIQAIGGHPMCGKEHAGFAAADANLFRNAMFILTPLARTSPRTLTLAKSLVETIGARPLVIDTERHDKIVAEISHLPYVIASVLMQTAVKHADTDELMFALAASGFRDTSRLAASDTTMMLDILMTNRDNVANAIRATMTNLETIADAIERGNEDALRIILQSIAEKRRAMFIGTRVNADKSKIRNRKLS